MRWWCWVLCCVMAACSPATKLRPDLLPIEFQVVFEQETILPGARGMRYQELSAPSDKVLTLMRQGAFDQHLAWTRPGFSTQAMQVTELNHHLRQGMRFFYARLQGVWALETRKQDLEPLVGCSLLGDRALRFYLAADSPHPFAGHLADLLLLGLAEDLLNQGATPVYPQAQNPDVARVLGVSRAIQPWEMNLLTGGEAGFLICRAAPPQRN